MSSAFSSLNRSCFESQQLVERLNADALFHLLGVLSGSDLYRLYRLLPEEEDNKECETDPPKLVWPVRTWCRGVQSWRRKIHRHLCEALARQRLSGGPTVSFYLHTIFVTGGSPEFLVTMLTNGGVDKTHRVCVLQISDGARKREFFAPDKKVQTPWTTPAAHRLTDLPREGSFRVADLTAPLAQPALCELLEILLDGITKRPVDWSCYSVLDWDFHPMYRHVCQVQGYQFEFAANAEPTAHPERMLANLLQHYHHRLHSATSHHSTEFTVLEGRRYFIMKK
jgi:hypothetical protein